MDGEAERGTEVRQLWPATNPPEVGRRHARCDRPSDARYVTPLRSCAPAAVLLSFREMITRVEHARDLRNVPPCGEGVAVSRRPRQERHSSYSPDF